ncbi:hypothetical protein QO200_00210 [Flavobacterium sp. Arc3]|uniref:hypothetical protein n=1 Tax=unclassified Flavobacterium TaxID=196869 RepID=UPI00352E7234
MLTLVIPAPPVKVITGIIDPFTQTEETLAVIIAHGNTTSATISFKFSTSLSK